MAQTLTQIGKYRIERELGRGAMGVVYKAFDPVVERHVAIKTIRLDVEGSDDLLNRLKREAKSVGQLEHPNIVTLYDAGESGGLFYLAMQFIQGQTLQNQLERQRWFTVKEVLEIFPQICAGLDYAHQRGVIHRDIKPANIMITNEGVVKLTDFGIAKLAGTGATSTGLIVGTPSYMSPEQAMGRPLDGRSDIFSVGSILYELITGEKAFPGQNTTTVMYKIVHEPPTPLAALQPGLDPALEQIVLTALAKNPDQRFQTCGALAAALERYIHEASAAIQKTFVARDLPGAAAQPPAPPASAAPWTSQATARPASSPGVPPAAAPSASGGTVPVAPASSGGVQPVAPSGTVAAPVPGRTGIPIAWLGGGVLGTLLLVVLILLVVQMRGPSSGPATGGKPASNTTQSAAPSSAPSPAGQPAGAPATSNAAGAQQPGGSAAGQPAAAASQSPSATRGVAAGSSPGQGTKPSSAARQNKPSEQPTARKPARETSSTPAAAPVTPTTTPTVQAPAAPAAAAAPETFDSLMLKGDLSFQGSKYQDALDAYMKAYNLNPRSAEAKRKIATAYMLLGKPEEAAKYTK